MTDHLTSLLDTAASQLEVPRPDPGAVLASGRRLRRRRRGATGIGVLGLAGTVVAALLVAGPPGSGSTIATDGPGSYLGGGAFSVGSTVSFGDTGRHEVDIKASVQSLDYTSAGVLVGRARSSSAEGDYPSSYALVSPDGDVRALPLDLDDRVIGTSPRSPYVAWAAAVDRDATTWTITVADARTGEVVATSKVDGAFTWGGWEAPPVTLDGNTVYVALDDRTAALDWRNGEITTAPQLGAAAIAVVAGGRAVVEDVPTPSELSGPGTTGPDGGPISTERVIDLSTGTVLLQLEGEYLVTSLSPDGRYLKAWYEYRSSDESGRVLNPGVDYEVHDLVLGTTTTFVSGAPWDVGWTPDGHRLRVDSDGVEVCLPATDRCEVAGAAPGPGRVRIGGSSYGS